MKQYQVAAYRDDRRGWLYRFFYDDETKARDKRAELLATLPACYKVEISEIIK